jgi:hypothetical protein
MCSLSVGTLKVSLVELMDVLIERNGRRKFSGSVEQLDMFLRLGRGWMQKEGP